MSAKSTPAVQPARAAAIDFRLLEYEYDPSAEAVGLQAAEALGPLVQRSTPANSCAPSFRPTPD
jgi:prolyl-tRNA editing enzyme YbaK/EbsC (Cys-tRNA(Pro) deacylase)